MQLNIHTPERGPNESFAEYAERRRASRRAQKEVTYIYMHGTGNRRKDDQHRTHKDRQARRQVIRLVGIRQYKKLQRLALSEL